MAGAAISWQSRVQPTVSASSTEAKFFATSDAGKTVLYIQSVLEDLGIRQEHATILFEDNCGALLLDNAHQFTKHSRHIDNHLFALQDWADLDLVKLHQLDTSFNAADLLTKPLSCQILCHHCKVLCGNCCPTFPKLCAVPSVSQLSHSQPSVPGSEQVGVSEIPCYLLPVTVE